MLKMQDVDLRGKRVLIREDFNVPLSPTGEITHDLRIQAALPTIRMALEQGAGVILLSHLGRPSEGQFDPKFSLKPVAKRLSQCLDQPVNCLSDWLEGIAIEPGEVVLCENVRFQRGEEANDPDLAKKIAALCDVFVMDAFGTAHRAQASTAGIAHFVPVSCAGPLLVAECEALDRVMRQPNRPLVTIVGGSKVSSKFGLLETLATQSDSLIVGGGIANTFLVAAGFEVGASLFEPDWVETARALLSKTQIPLPTDVITAKSFAIDAPATPKAIQEIAPDDLILDIGPETLATYTQIIRKAKTILWNGPVGVFEWPAFAVGTLGLAKAISASTAYTVAGGGDTLAAIDKANVSQDISYLSTGGGAFLEYIEGKALPGIVALQ